MIVTFYHTTHNLVSENGYHHLITLVTQVGYLDLKRQRVYSKWRDA